MTSVLSYLQEEAVVVPSFSAALQSLPLMTSRSDPYGTRVPNPQNKNRSFQPHVQVTGAVLQGPVPGFMLCCYHLEIL